MEDVTLMSKDPPPKGTETSVGEISNTSMPACSTFTVWESPESVLTVMVVDLVEVCSCLLTFTLTVPLPLADAGVTVHQLCGEETVQSTLDDTVKVCSPPSESNWRDSVETDRTGLSVFPSWVTETGTHSSLSLQKTIAPFLSALSEFSAALKR